MNLKILLCLFTSWGNVTLITSPTGDYTSMSTTLEKLCYAWTLPIVFTVYISYVSHGKIVLQLDPSVALVSHLFTYLINIY